MTGEVAVAIRRTPRADQRSALERLAGAEEWLLEPVSQGRGPLQPSAAESRSAHDGENGAVVALVEDAESVDGRYHA
jgi:hypothetical protein